MVNLIYSNARDVHAIQGGGGGVTASVDGAAITNWKCVTIDMNDDPETVYPGCTYPEYDDSAWTEALVSKLRVKCLCFYMWGQNTSLVDSSHHSYTSLDIKDAVLMKAFT